jgi:MFS family permease
MTGDRQEKEKIIDKSARAVLVRGRTATEKKEKNSFIIINGKIERKKDIKVKIERKIQKSLNYSTAEGTLNAAAGSITESYITPFALALGANNLQIGLLSSMRDLANTIGQIPGARFTQYFERKAIWLYVQIISKVLLWVPIILLPFIAPGTAVLLLIILFAAFGFFSALRSPAWSSLMGDLVPMKIRGSYFAKRNTATGLSGVVATMAAGYLLTYFGFPLIFTIAIVLSAISIPIFLRMYEPPFRKIYHYRHSFSFSPREWKSTIKVNKSLVIFTIYIFFMYFAVEVASPFYSVYMLRDLHISYIWFAAITVVGALARIISFKYWGKLNDRFGSRKILVISGIFACFTPLGWALVFDVFSILALKIFDGLVWSGFDMVVFNYLLDVTPAEKRPQYVANHNFFTGVGVVLGAFAGGVLAEMWTNSSFIWLTGLQLVFMLSFFMRLSCLSLLPKISEVTIKQSDVPIRYVFMKVIAVEPARNLLSSIVYTFRYPYNREQKIRKQIAELRYKMRLSRA